MNKVDIDNALGSAEWLRRNNLSATAAMMERLVSELEAAEATILLMSRQRVEDDRIIADLRTRIRRVELLLPASDDGTEYEHVDGCEGEETCPACWVASIRQALVLERLPRGEMA